MMFDKKWETEIYSAKRQLNKYPFDSLVSIVHYLFKKKIKNNISALDLGCGAGNNTKFLIDFVVMIDICLSSDIFSGVDLYREKVY